MPLSKPRKLAPPKNAFATWIRNKVNYSFGSCCGTTVFNIENMTRKEMEEKFHSAQHRIMLAYGHVGKPQDKDGLVIKHIKTKNGPITIRGRDGW